MEIHLFWSELSLVYMTLRYRMSLAIMLWGLMVSQKGNQVRRNRMEKQNLNRALHKTT